MSRIYVAPNGLKFFVDCERGLHVWKDRKLSGGKFIVLECVLCNAVDGCGLDPELLQILYDQETKRALA